MEQEELYDDCQMPVSPSGLSALKSKFEKSSSPAPTKPSFGTKPTSANIAAKFGGSVSTGTKSPSSVIGQDKLKSANKPETVTSKSDENSTNKPDIVGKPSLAKRNSKLNIPAAFQSATDPPPSFDKPKPTVKPTVPTWKQKHDDSNNNKETVINSNVSKHSAEEPSKMLAKEPKENGLPKKPFAIPTGNVKERANALFGGASPMDLKSALKPVSAKKPDITGKPEGSPKPLSPKRVGYTPNQSTVELREKFGAAQIKSKRKSVKSIVRSKDNRKFHKVEVEDIKSETPKPSKPEKLGTEIDWDKLGTDFKKLLTELDSSEGANGFEEFEEEYDDIANVRRETRAISIIQPLTEEEEQEWEANGFKGQTDSNASLPPPPAGKNNNNPKAESKEWLQPEPEDYDTAEVLLQNGAAEDTDELYEPLPEEPFNDTPPPLQPKPKTNETPGKPPVPPPVDHIEKKDQKELEKERKRKEKEEKELLKKKEKELKKRDDDLKHLMSKYKIDAAGLTMSVGKGTVRKAAKASKKDLAVEAGDKVNIIRMVDNDKGKWLIRILDTDKVGYVDSTNVEVDTNIIKNLMKSTGEGDEDGETYEFVDGENLPEPIEEEIYEVVN